MKEGKSRHASPFGAVRRASCSTVPRPRIGHSSVFWRFGQRVGTGGLAGRGTVEQGDSVRLTAAGSPVFTAASPDGAELLVWETG